MPIEQPTPFRVRLTHPTAKPITLLGTVHTSVEPPPSYLQALDKARWVYFEVDPERTQPLKRYWSPHPLRPDQLERVVGAWSALGWWNPDYLGRSPMDVALALCAAWVEWPALDYILWRHVPYERRASLENAVDRARLLERLDVDLQHAYLDEVLDQIEAGSDSWAYDRAVLVQDWREGRFPTLPDDLVGVLVRMREAVWMPQIIESSREATTAVVCGAGHIPSLARELEAEGYRRERCFRLVHGRTAVP